MTVNKFFVLLIIISLQSCSYKANNELRLIKQCFESRDISFDKELETCLIIPEVGCGGCIDGSIYFLKENLSHFLKGQNKNMFILTSVNSKKIFLRTLGENNLDKYNCIWDNDNKYLISGNNSIYPLLLYLEEGEIIDAKFQTPYSRSDYFVEFEKKIKNEI